MTLIPGRDVLRPYQGRIAETLVEGFGRKPGYLLALHMSLGKTVTVLSAAKALLDRTEVKRILVVAPLRVAQKTWPDEIKAWPHLAGLTWVSLCGEQIGKSVPKARREETLRRALRAGTEIIICNRENIPWLYEAVGGAAGWPFDMMIYDESSRLKEGRKKTRGTRRLSEFGVLAKVRPAMSYVIELTGTPTVGGIKDLWGQVYIIDQGRRLGAARTGFLNRWFISDYMGYNHTPRPHAETEIMGRVDDIMISLKATDVIDLPPVVYTTTYVDMTDKEREQYNRFVRTLALEEYDVDAPNRGVLAFKLLQYAQGRVYRTPDQESSDAPEVISVGNHKFDALDAILDEMGDEPVILVWTYRSIRDEIVSRYEGVVRPNDPGALDRWNRGEVRILATHPAQIGHGMNLQFGGHHIIWLGLHPSLELYQQLNARLPRPGQKAERVYVRHVVMRDTFEQDVLSILSNRGATQERVMDAVSLRMNEALDDR